MRLTYAQWYRRISAFVAGFDSIGLKPGDHLVTALQNRWSGDLHWACQFAGIIYAGQLAFDRKRDRFYCKTPGPRPRRRRRIRGRGTDRLAQKLPRIALDAAPPANRLRRARLALGAGREAARQCRGLVGDALHLRDHGRPKGVPRRQRAERAAALAHVAQNLYATASARSASCRSITPWACARSGHVARRRRLHLPAPLRCRRSA